MRRLSVPGAVIGRVVSSEHAARTSSGKTMKRANSRSDDACCDICILDEASVAIFCRNNCALRFSGWAPLLAATA
jgi:hypothetical protein